MDTLCPIHGVALATLFENPGGVAHMACPVCWPVVYTSDPFPRKQDAGSPEEADRG